MEDVGLQRAIWASLQQQQQQPRAPPPLRIAPQPQRRPTDIAPTLPRPRPANPAPQQASGGQRYSERFSGKRDTLAREGILPTAAKGGAPPPQTGGARASSEPLPRGVGPASASSDKLFRWSEIASGGRVQQQKPSGGAPGTGGGFSALLVTDEPFNGAVTVAPASAVVAVRHDDPVELSAATGMQVSLQSLGSRGRYALAFVGFTTSAKVSPNAVLSGVAVHFTPTGEVCLGVETWGLADDGSAEQIAVAARPVQVRPVRDRLVLELRLAPHGVALQVNCNGAANMFPSLPVPFNDGGGGSGAPLTAVHPVLLVAGGRMSFRDVRMGPADALHLHPQSPGRVTPSTTSSSSTPPLPPAVKAARQQQQQQQAPSRAAVSGGAPPPPAAGKPVVTFPELADAIEREILDRSLNVAWDDVAGLGDAKRLLHEAVILPTLMPDLFSGASGIKPWKGILLYGPPGTGKTLLAKAVATTSKCTFFNMSSSTLLMKHFGDSEKMVKTLFQLARHYSPSIVFFDEIDAIMSRKSTDGGDGGGGSQEVMRRVRAEMLGQIDGLHGAVDGRVVVIATTNCPWDLDEAMRRRLEKRIYVPLPDAATRAAMLRHCCKASLVGSAVDFDGIAASCEGHSGADMSVVCREALMGPVRRLIDGRTPMELAAMQQRGEVKAGPVLPMDFAQAVQRVQPSVGGLARYGEWQAQFGSA